MKFFISSIIALVVTSLQLVNTSIENNHINQFTETEDKTCSTGPFRKFYTQKDFNVNNATSPGEPLFITPLLNANKIKEARQKSSVQLGHRHGHSYAGYITVNQNYESNLFFWFFSARNNTATAPVIVWLQGGPGASSLYGLFTENGPYYVNEDLQLMPRNYSWNLEHHVLYIDNPVGTGFSFTRSEDGYARNEVDVGTDLYTFMLQFYKLFPELQKNKLFIAGESYGGKYAPALTYAIHKMNPTAKFKMNLKGMAIGDGLSDPVSMTNYGDLLYQIGLIDGNGLEIFKNQEKIVITYIKQKKYEEAFKVFDRLLNGDFTKSGSYFYNLTGLTNYYNFVDQNGTAGLDIWLDFVNQPSVRKQIHVGNLTFNSGEKVEKYLISDIMKSVKPWIEEIADHYSVLFYNGQLDIIIAYPLTENFIKTLNWKYAKQFQKAKRMIWRVDGEVAGYVKEAPNFAFVLVRNAGHMVPYDQPKWAYDMISRFTKYS